MSEKVEKKQRMSNEEADKILEDIADFMELDTERQLFKDTATELKMAVKLEKLSFDESTETFKLALRKPIIGKKREVHFVEIKSCDLDSKRVLQKFTKQQSIDQARAMVAAYTDLEEFEVKELKDLDQGRIIAIVMGFITQTEPTKND